jgi:hypothetical protein
MVRWHTPETSLPQVSRKLLMRKTFVTIGQGKCERIASWQRRRRWQRRGCRRWLVCWRRIYHRAEHAQHCGLLELERKEDRSCGTFIVPLPSCTHELPLKMFKFPLRKRCLSSACIKRHKSCTTNQNKFLSRGRRE